MEFKGRFGKVFLTLDLDLVNGNGLPSCIGPLPISFWDTQVYTWCYVLLVALNIYDILWQKQVHLQVSDYEWDPSMFESCINPHIFHLMKPLFAYKKNRSRSFAFLFLLKSFDIYKFLWIYTKFDIWYSIIVIFLAS